MATPRIERLVKDAHMSLLVSLDGDLQANAERPFVSGQPSYPVVARNLPKLVDWAPEVVVRMTYHPKALDLVGNVRHVFGLGAPSIALCPVVEAPWHEHEAALEQAYQALADWYLSEARQGHVPALEITHQFLTQLDYARPAGPERPDRAAWGPTSWGSMWMGTYSHVTGYFGPRTGLATCGSRFCPRHAGSTCTCRLPTCWDATPAKPRPFAAAAAGQWWRRPAWT